jgi:hypothetical protein
MPLITNGFETVEQLRRHWSEHGDDFGASNLTDYEEMADSFLGDVKPEGVHECVRACGAILRYDPTSEAFGVLDAQRIIRTYFKPIPCAKVPSHQRESKRRLDVAILPLIISFISSRSAKNDNRKKLRSKIHARYVATRWKPRQQIIVYARHAALNLECMMLMRLLPNCESHGLRREHSGGARSIQFQPTGTRSRNWREQVSRSSVSPQVSLRPLAHLHQR